MKKTDHRLPASRLSVYVLALLKVEPRMMAPEMKQSLEPLVGDINPGTLFRMMRQLCEQGFARRLKDGSWRATEAGMRELDRHVGALRTILSGEVE